ncbi:MAG TPA: response regulator [Rhodanobacteraceae bacterium]|nr:response regulator [Rhodanobacteraceae bacterium]
MSQPQASVLLVEDDKTLAATIIWALAGRGYIVCGPASNVDEALQVLDECDADVAVIDYQLIDGTSEPLLPHLEQQQVPVCVVTGTHPDELPISYRKHALLEKPFGPRELIDEVERLLH